MKEKLSPRYMVLYKVVKRINKVEYKLELPMELPMVHPVFLVSMLRMFVGDPNSIVPLEDVGVEDNLTYEEVLVECLITGHRYIYGSRT